MAKTWYPVIDYPACMECGACVAKCSHNVYDSTKAPSPIVKNPEACVDHCHGCGNLCPAGAITYVGDDTGWTPPKSIIKANPSLSSCRCEETFGKKVLVEYLYLDLQICDRCIGTDAVLEEVMTALTPALQLAGYETEYKKVKMETAAMAERYRFLSSPTIRVNGEDICPRVAESSCGCCSEISGTDIDCRVFEYGGKTYDVPPEEMLAEAILRAIFGQSEGGSSCGSYDLPDNLKSFFDGKKSKSGCSCGGDCC